MEHLSEKTRKKTLSVFYIVIAAWCVALGLSDSVFANYFKDAYNVTALQRGFIELPRELPGILCVFIVSAFVFLGDIRISVIAQVLCIIGLIVLGIHTPSFAVMLIFLFINSVGAHIFYPLQYSIGMSLQGGKNVGTGLGKLKSFGIIFSMITGIIVFFGFRFGFFTFYDNVVSIFLFAAAAHCVAGVFLGYISRLTRDGQPSQPKKFQIIFKKKYSLYYILAICNGVQKQIRLVYGPWVLIELLSKKADTIAILGIVSAFAGIFFLRFVGWMIDRYGLKQSVLIQAVSYIFVYAAYAVLSYGFFSGGMANAGIAVIITYAVYMFDRMTQHLTVINAVYLQSIAEVSSDVTPSLSMGFALDHIVSIACALAGGAVWLSFGPHYVFIITAVMSFGNLIVSFLIKEDSLKKT